MSLYSCLDYREPLSTSALPILPLRGSILIQRFRPRAEPAAQTASTHVPSPSTRPGSLLLRAGAPTGPSD